jgi:hypothetical protein
MAWATLLMVLIQFILVMMRYVFSAQDFLFLSTLWWQEAIVYLHGALICCAAATPSCITAMSASTSSTARRRKRPEGLDRPDRLADLPAAGLLPDLLVGLAQCGAVLGESGRLDRDLGHPVQVCAQIDRPGARVPARASGDLDGDQGGLRLLGHEVDDPYRDEESLD